MADDFKVPYTTIKAITPHPNAERLEVAWVYGFQVIVQKDKYKAGDAIVYVPVDSILPVSLENRLFPVDSKIKLHHHRVRQIRIRGLASQGMIINSEDTNLWPFALFLETDLKDKLGITKYEPPQPGFANVQGKKKQRNRKHEHPLFHKYNGLDNIKWFPDLFQPGDAVTIQEKMHGTNARASKLPYAANTLWKKVKKLLGLAPSFECCYGSNNVEISAATSYKGFYGEDIYGACFKKMNIFEKIQVGEIVYGEIVGPGIQKNYEYGLKEHEFVVFDVKVLQPDGKLVWLSPKQVETYCLLRGLRYVPILFYGYFDKDHAYSLTKGKSMFNPVQKVREGIVIKANNDYNVEGNKKAVKWVSEDYLSDASNTDFH